MADDAAGWSLTESDPGIFSILLRELGVKGIEVEELWGLDDEIIEQLEPMHALIFLFKWVGGTDRVVDGTPAPDAPIFFAKQTITNACATLALLNAILNIDDPANPIELGEELSNLKAFSQGLDSETTGDMIGQSLRIREAHNSFAVPDPYSLDEMSRERSEDAYHFIAYLPIDGQLYELDGLKSSPLSHGEIPDGKKWTSLAKDVLERRIATYKAGAIEFNLQAVTSRSTSLANRLTHKKGELSLLESAGKEEIKVGKLKGEIRDIEEKLYTIRERFAEWETDNALRKHNYISLIHSLLLAMAKEGKLTASIAEAKEDRKKTIAEMKAKGKGAEMEED